MIQKIKDHPVVSIITLLGSLASIIALFLYLSNGSDQRLNIVSERNDRSMINKSAVQLISTFDDRTTLQAEELVDELFKGKWVKFYYPLQEAEAETYSDEIRITLEPFTEDERFRIIAYFDSAWKKRISDLNKGEPVAVLGKIETITSSRITLVDSELIEASEKMKSRVKILNKMNKLAHEKLEKFVPGIFTQFKKENVEEMLNQIRKQNEVRSLMSIESGRRISNTPPGTYFFMSVWFLSTDENDYKYMRRSINRFPTDSSYFELHYLQEGQLNILGYINSSHIPNISVLDGVSRKEITISPILDEQFNTLIILPMSRVIASSYRTIEISKKKNISVLDLVVY